MVIYAYYDSREILFKFLRNLVPKLFEKYSDESLIFPFIKSRIFYIVKAGNANCSSSGIARGHRRK